MCSFGLKRRKMCCFTAFPRATCELHGRPVGDPCIRLWMVCTNFLTNTSRSQWLLVLMFRMHRKERCSIVLQCSNSSGSSSQTQMKFPSSGWGEISHWLCRVDWHEFQDIPAEHYDGTLSDNEVFKDTFSRLKTNCRVRRWEGIQMSTDYRTEHRLSKQIMKHKWTQMFSNFTKMWSYEEYQAPLNSCLIQILICIRLPIQLKYRMFFFSLFKKNKHKTKKTSNK